MRPLAMASGAGGRNPANSCGGVGRARAGNVLQVPGFGFRASLGKRDCRRGRTTAQLAATAGSSAPARRRLGGKSERVGELQQMPEEVVDALVGQCGGPALVLATAASNGGARAGHKELGRLGM
jgi:hypothetical protein